MTRRHGRTIAVGDAAPSAVADRLKLADGVAFMARVLSARADLLFHRLTGQDDVTPRQFGVLLTLHQRGALTLTALAAAIDVDRSTLGEMTRRMGERGLLSRSGNAADRRSAKVEVTPEGHAVLLGLVAGAARLQGELLATLPPESRDSFVDQLTTVVRSLRADSRSDQPGR